MYPSRQPVMEYVFDRELHTIVRSAIPGRVDMYSWWYGANTMCSYTSSVMTNVSNSMASPAI